MADSTNNDYDAAARLMGARTTDRESPDGGPAFGGAFDTVLFLPTRPSIQPSTLEFRSRGMSLRDYFAGQALIGMLGPKSSYWQTAECTKDNIAKACYAMADAMLTAREAK